MKNITIQEIEDMDRFKKTNFINSLSGFKSVTLIGTISEKGIPNLAIFSNIVHIGADPVYIGFINRPKEAALDTITNIESTGIFTMNHIKKEFVDRAHQTSAKYPNDQSEFEKVGLTPAYKKGILAPFVGESNVQYALKLADIIPIKFNGTFLVIGSLLDVFIDPVLMQEDGHLALDQAGSLTSLGIYNYYETNFIAKFPYAKP